MPIIEASLSMKDDSEFFILRIPIHTYYRGLGAVPRPPPLGPNTARTRWVELRIHSACGSGALVRCLVPSFSLSPFCGTKAFWDEGTTRGCPPKKVNAISGIRHRHRGQSNLNIHAPRQVHNRLVTRSPGSPLTMNRNMIRLKSKSKHDAIWRER